MLWARALTWVLLLLAAWHHLPCSGESEPVVGSQVSLLPQTSRLSFGSRAREDLREHFLRAHERCGMVKVLHNFHTIATRAHLLQG